MGRVVLLCACRSDYAFSCLRIIVFIYRFSERANRLNVIQINLKPCCYLQNSIHVGMFQDAIFTFFLI